MEDVYFEIADHGYFLRIQPIKITSNDFVIVNVSVKAGVFSGIYKAEFQTHDFNYLKENFSYLYNNLTGDFDFENIEADLALKVKSHGVGHFSMLVSAYDMKKFPNENVLKFELFFDQTHINNCLYQLEKIIKSFP